MAGKDAYIRYPSVRPLLRDVVYRLTARRTAVGKSSWLEATSEVRVPMKPWPARWVVPGGKSEL